MKTRFRDSRPLLVSLLTLGFFCLVLVAQAGSAAPASTNALSSSSSVQTVDLEYRELPQPLISLSANVTQQKAPFAKEPALRQRDVMRGKISFGSTDSKNVMPFLWDYSQGKLYFDLNGNQDLTDDPAGVFSCATRYSGEYQIFTNVHFALKTPTGSHPATVDLTLIKYSGINSFYAAAAYRSFWEGKISLQGREYQLGFVDNNPDFPDGGYLVLRPWESRSQPFSLLDGSLNGFTFNRNLFFGTQAWRLDCKFLPQEPAPKYRITIEERTTELAELDLTGKFIKRLVLTPESGRAGYTVVLDTPAPVVKIPAGSYNQVQVALKAGAMEASRIEDNLVPGPSRPIIKTSSAKPAVLAAGGPLTNSVTLSRQGASLSLSYQLLGADGGRYRLLGPRKEPEFAIYRADKKVASGKFEFG